jgi:hypothetical protein
MAGTEVEGQANPSGQGIGEGLLAFSIRGVTRRGSSKLNWK